MASITVGTGCTAKSTTVEGLLQELCTYLQIGEFSAVNNPNTINNIIGTHLQDSKTFSVNYSIPVKQNLNAQGQVVYSALDYLSDLDFTPGTGGTFKSETCAGYLMEVLIFAQNLEQDTTKNPGRNNYVTGQFNSDSTIFSGSINLPVSASINSTGGVTYVADEYLVS